ncbi:D-Ala-D-Ala carboxypeptidase family metallohydrolase [Priestia sp. JV24]|uniref:D-Ala-D-Ala carboxypeptidase family metallohydrolase n=1 Tax=Priestia TaxID=2800373 RepID=UPI0021D69365|nr:MULTISPECIES: D-Ala-D-Ala carboxypeptidase family metallohydrolase [Priestia]MCU7712480.1 D-Ala-D-Ala carboxypeptidase family metallohydrolase [Priestia megaterium]MCW1046309.1 D-Ala-D-Ala carboxypeptidase family metallohydrolase [Priestia sp. JV24]
MSTVGQSNIQITADDQQARRTIGGFFRGMEAQGRRFTNRMQRFDPLIGVTNSVKNTRQTLAGLQDDFEGLGEGKTFQRITKSLNRVQNGLKTTGQVSQKSLKEMQKEIERVRSTLNELGDDQPFEEMREALAQTERQFQSFQSTTRRFRFNQIENLPDHLKSFQRELNESRRQMRQMTQEGTKSLDDLADAAVKSSVGLEKITSVTKSGKSAIKIIQDLGDSTKETQLAILGLNRNGTVKISTEETTRRLGQFKEELEDSKRKLEALRDAGDFGSYEAGMRVVEKKLSDVNRAMYAASKGGQAYQKMINELGVNTSDTANQAAIAMEAYKDRFIRSVDMMNAKSNQSKKMMDILPEVSHIQRVDKFFLGIGNRLEDMAKKGTAANIAIDMLGKNASMKDLNDRIMLINQGLMRMNQVALGLGIALAGFTAAMFNATKGPEMADVFEQRGQLLLDYQKAVEDRTQEIVDTWGLFEKAEVEKIKPETLMKNLQGQVDVMKNWASNIDSLAKRGIDEGLLDSLRKMGPEAAGQIQALTKMSDSELNNYVALWKEKHALARKEALTELEGLQKETSQKIKELENSLTPLGISLEKAKSTWLQALQPFIDIWGKIAAKVVDGATAIGEFVNKLNELNPSITASAGMFLYLFNAISLILAPMAIGIGRANGMKAAFSATFLIIKPFVLGFLRIAGAATVVSGALVLVGGTFIKLWKNSENLRSAVMSLWDTLKEAGITIAAPFVKAFQMISKEVTAFLNKMVGSDAQNMASFWQSIGDKIAVGINKIRDVIQPVAEKIASVVDAFVEWEGFLPVVAGLTAAFVTYKATVIGIAAAVKAWNLIQKASVATMALMRGAMIAYTVAGGGLQGILAVVTAAQRALNLSMMMNPIGLIIAAIVGLGVAFVVAYKKSETFRNFVNKLFDAFKTGASAVLGFLKNNWPEVLATITGPIGWAVYAVVKYWDQIKSATITAFNSVITFFQEWGPLLLAVISGPIGLAVYAVVKNWDAIKNATITAFNAVTKFLSDTWNGIKLITSIVVNAMVEDVRNQWNQFKSMTTTAFNAVKSFFSSVWNGIKSIVSTVVNAIVTNVNQQWNDLKSLTSTVFNGIKSFFSTVWDGIKSIFTTVTSTIFNSVKQSWENTKSNTTTVFNAVKSFLSSVWDGIKSVVNNAASAVFNYVKDKWNSLKTSTTNIFNDIKSFLTTVWNRIKSFVQDTATAIYNKVKTPWNNIKSNTTSIFNGIKSFLISLWDNIKSRITTSVNNIKSGVVNAWNSVKSQTTTIFNNIKSKVTGIFDDIVSAAKKLPGRIGDGIKSMASGVKKGVKSFANVLVKAMGSGLNGAIDGINWVLEKVDAPKIKKWTVPEYAKGTDGHPGGPAVLGDGKKKEAYVTPDGRMGISPATDTLYNLPAGTRVFDGNQTAKMLKGVPMYAKGIGNKLKDLGGKAVDKGQELYEHAKDKTKKGVKKAKDLALDVWDYMSDPKGLMKKVFGNFIPDLPKLGASAGDMLKGGVKKAKDSSIEFIKSQLDAFMSTSDGGGDGSTVGPGSGYGGMHPYVEAWYRKVKDKFGPTKFMGGYNNRNVRGGSSKSMHAYGRAFDIGGSAKTMSKIAEWARTHMNNLQYAIYNRRIAGPGMGSKWRKYSGVNPHTDHVHLDFMTGGGGGGKTGPSGKGAERWRSSIKKAAAQMKEKLSASELNGIIAQIYRESKGDQGITQDPRVNDINARTGNLAKGLLQYVPSTFRAYALKGHTNIMSGYDQLLAFFNNKTWRRDLPYGRRGWGPRGGRKYEKGGIIDRVQMALMGEGNKEEVIIPLEQFKDRAIKLLMYAAEKLGFDMTGMFNAQPQTLGASSFSNVQSAMTTMSNKVSPEGLKLQGNSGQVIEVVVHNHTELDGKELAKGSYKYTTEYQERDKRSKSSFQKERG